MINNISYRFLVKSFIFCYVTLVVMNSMKPYPVVEMIGKYGKLAIILLALMIFLPFLYHKSISIKLRNQWVYLLIYTSLILFSLIHVYFSNLLGNLVYNVLLFLYIFYFYVMIKILWHLNFKEQQLQSFENTKITIFKTYRSALFLNLVFWFILAFLTNKSFYDNGEFGGFFQNEIHFGLYTATGFLTCFYMRFNNIEKDSSKFNMALMLTYLVLAYFTSRNAILIIIIAPLYYFLVFNIKKVLYALPILMSPVLVAYLNEISSNISTDRLNKVSSGRIDIWNLSLENIMEIGIFKGSGIFNLNDTVLQKNQGTGNYYFDRIDFLYFHNSFIELLAGGGIIALILFIWVLIDAWKYFTRIEKAIMCAIIIGGTLESYLVQPFMLISSLFYFILLVSTSQMKVLKLIKSS